MKNFITYILLWLVIFKMISKYMQIRPTELITARPSVIYWTLRRRKFPDIYSNIIRISKCRIALIEITDIVYVGVPSVACFSKFVMYYLYIYYCYIKCGKARKYLLMIKLYVRLVITSKYVYVDIKNWYGKSCYFPIP